MSEKITVGSVSVDVVPNTEKFADRLRAALDPQARRMGEQLGKSLGDAMARELKAQGFELKVKADTSQAKTSIEDLYAEIDKAIAKTAGLGDEMDKTGAKGDRMGTLLNRGLGKVVSALAKGVGGLGDALGKVGWQAAQNGLNNVSAAMQGVANGSSGAQLAVVGLVIAAIGMGSAIIPVAAVTAGAILGIAAAASAATLGLAAIGIVGYSVFSNVLGASGAYQSAVTAQAKALTAFQKTQISDEFALGFDKGNQKAPGAAAAALALANKQGLGTRFLPNGLSQSAKSSTAQAQAALAAANANLAQQTKALGPQGVAVSNQWQGIQNQFQGIVHQLQPTVLPILAAGLRLVGVGLNYLAPIVKTVAPVIVTLLNDAGKALASPQAQAFAAYIAKAAPGVIRDIGQIVGKLLAALPGFIEKFTPIGKAILDWLNNAVTGFGKVWDGQGMQLFIAYFKQNAPLVANLLKQIAMIAETLGALFVGLAPAGSVALRVVGWIAQALQIVLKPAVIAISTAFSGFVLIVLEGLAKTLEGVGQVMHAFHLPFADSVTNAGKKVDQFATDFQNQVALMNSALTGKLIPNINKVAGVHKVTFQIAYNVLGQAYNPATGLLYPKNAFSAPGAVSHSGSGPSGQPNAPVLPGGRRSATGGLVLGPGTSRSDSVPMWLSTGEYVVNAQATKANLAALQAMNSGGGVQGGKRETNINVTGFGADQVANAIVTRERAMELLYG
jgi:hypothetical protein